MCLHTLSKHFAYLRRFVQSLESVPTWSGSWTTCHSTIVTPLVHGAVQASEIYAASYGRRKSYNVRLLVTSTTRSDRTGMFRVFHQVSTVRGHTLRALLVTSTRSWRKTGSYG